MRDDGLPENARRGSAGIASSLALIEARPARRLSPQRRDRWCRGAGARMTPHHGIAERNEE